MKVRCPKCQRSDGVQAVGDTHYICYNCEDRPQFTIVPDDKIHFPYNEIFVKRKTAEFYRVPYLKLRDIGVQET